MTARAKRVVWTVPGAASDRPGNATPIFLFRSPELACRFCARTVKDREGTEK